MEFGIFYSMASSGLWPLVGHGSVFFRSALRNFSAERLFCEFFCLWWSRDSTTSNYRN